MLTTTRQALSAVCAVIGLVMLPMKTAAGSSLEAVSAAGASDVWAVGYMWTSLGGAVEYRTVTDHWNGSAWTMVPSPDRETAPAVDTLYGVSALSSSDAWAVGVSSPSGQPPATLVLHWDGSVWRIVSTPNPIVYGNYLVAVSAHGSDVWAVGFSEDPARNQIPLVLHSDAAGWHVDSFPIPSMCADEIVLTGAVATGSTPSPARARTRGRWVTAR